MKQLRFLVPILGILVAAAPYILKGQQLNWGVTALGVLVFLGSGLPLIAQYFKFGKGGGLKPPQQ